MKSNKRFLIQVRQPNGSWKTVATKEGYGAANMRLHALAARGNQTRIVDTQPRK